MAMSYIKSVVPLKGHRLFMEMESGSSVTIDLSVKIHTMKYKDLNNESLVRRVATDGDYVFWDERVKVTAKELMDIVLFGPGNE